MKFIMFALLIGCGYSSKENTLTGQAKKIVHNTPLFCSDYTEVDMSLGVMRDGIGSMSTQDKWLIVEDEEHAELLEDAIKVGAILDVTYDVVRLPICPADNGAYLTKIEIVN